MGRIWSYCLISALPLGHWQIKCLLLWPVAFLCLVCYKSSKIFLCYIILNTGIGVPSLINMVKIWEYGLNQCSSNLPAGDVCKVSIENKISTEIYVLGSQWVYTCFNHDSIRLKRIRKKLATTWVFSVSLCISVSSAPWWFQKTKMLISRLQDKTSRPNGWHQL